MPTHAMRPHEWGTQGLRLEFMYGPPAVGGAGEDQSGGEERECEESFAHGEIPFSDWCEVRVRSLLEGVK